MKVSFSLAISYDDEIIMIFFLSWAIYIPINVVKAIGKIKRKMAPTNLQI